MLPQAMSFAARASEKLADVRLQANLKQATHTAVDTLAAAARDYDQDADFEALRDAGAAIRARVLADLDVWLELFERNARASGASVIWARDGAEISAQVLAIASQYGVRKVVKSKSMLSEEAGLNAALSAAGIEVVETDLGQYILQIAGDEAPAHIIAPALHKNLDEVAELFARTHKTPRKGTIGELAREAREVLRRHFLSAGMGISGGNFLVAESGSVALVTNEGNGRMVTTLPQVHVVITGIEKVVPTFDDLATLLRLLTRSATGQPISNYVSLLTGAKRAGDPDGPQHLVFILVDNGRVGLLGSAFQPVLRCIRCGACMHHCPVYQSIGGQAYGGVYPGPLGALLTPLFSGLESALDLPHASTLCHQCAVVCPVRIPLPELLRTLREQETALGLRPASERLWFKVWAWLAGKPWAYRLAGRIARIYLASLAGGRRPSGLLSGWSIGRDFPAPQAQTFGDLYARQQAARGKEK
jgi:L-lactate dehydrogenase complex protein LldF